jgi:hypothetical protein
MKLTHYKLKDFGLPEYHDPIIPVNILMILIGFCILLFNKAVDYWGNNIKVISVVCGSLYMITYMFYISEYYEKIWAPYFSLPNDKMFFRIYALLIGIVIITFMQNFPEYWYLYSLLLMLILYYKKNKTRAAFQKAFNDEYGSFDIGGNNIDKAKFLLCQDFSSNFLKYGVLFNIFYAIILFLLFEKNPIEKFNILSVDFSVDYYAFASVSLTIFIVGFWIKKITSGINLMVEKVKSGDYEYFKEHI